MTTSNKLSDLIAPQFHDVHKAMKENLYSQYWLKGGRGSTKSSVASAQIVLGVVKDPDANAVIFRRYQNELRDTVFGQVEWAINKLGLENMFICNVSPMQMIYKPTGQKIIFKAADSPGKVKSINLGKGYIKYCWFEEVSQFRCYEDIRNILQSLLRGEGKYTRSTIFTYNPPKSSRSWVNQEVKLTREDRLVHSSTYLDVPEEWLGETFLTEARHLEKVNPTAYAHEYLGEEVGTGLEVFTNVTLQTLTDEDISNFDKIRQGLDFGFSVDPASVARMHFDSKRKRLYIFGEIYQINLFNDQLANMIHTRGWNDVMTIADSASPKDIADLGRNNIRVRGVKKGPGSIEHGIKFLQGLEAIIIDDIRCPNAAREFMNYSLDIDAMGIPKANFPDKDDHCITGDTIINTVDGDIPIKELVGKEGMVNCFNENKQSATVSKFFDVRKTQSNIDVYEIKTEDGRIIKATDYHPILTNNGWKLLKELQVGDHIVDISSAL